MMQLSQRQIVLLAIALVTLVLLTLFLAPSVGNGRQHGSTYSLAPHGYGAWYAYMQERGTPVGRWQKPAEVLFYPKGSEAKKYTSAQKPAPTPPITLLRVSNSIEALDLPDEQWIKQGNVLILLGVKQQATEAAFTSDLDSTSGKVRVETSRRHTIANRPGEALREVAVVGDRFGAAVWQETVGKGKIVYASTSYLAANAYQNFRANYELLAKLVTEPGHPILVDEYLHGYKDPPLTVKDGKTVETQDNLISYLMRTPLALLAIQAIVLLAVLIWGQNRRLGKPEAVLPPLVDNSEAYVGALASVLHKAECSEFVVETVGKAEQLTIQKALGLGTTLLPTNTLIAAWQQQTGRPAQELNSVLKVVDRRHRISSAELLKWVENVKTVRQQLPKGGGRD